MQELILNDIGAVAPAKQTKLPPHVRAVHSLLSPRTRATRGTARRASAARVGDVSPLRRARPTQPPVRHVCVPCVVPGPVVPRVCTVFGGRARAAAGQVRHSPYDDGHDPSASQGACLVFCVPARQHTHTHEATKGAGDRAPVRAAGSASEGLGPGPARSVPPGAGTRPCRRAPRPLPLARKARAVPLGEPGVCPVVLERPLARWTPLAAPSQRQAPRAAVGQPAPHKGGATLLSGAGPGPTRGPPMGPRRGELPCSPLAPGGPCDQLLPGQSVPALGVVEEAGGRGDVSEEVGPCCRSRNRLQTRTTPAQGRSSTTPVAPGGRTYHESIMLAEGRVAATRS